MKRRKRPEPIKKLWWWVTDGQYAPLEKYVDAPMSRRESWAWGWRENLIEVPVKKMLCLLYGHYFGACCHRHPEGLCLYCSKEAP